MGPERAASLLAAGCSDMGGSIMAESITRAAGEQSACMQGRAGRMHSAQGSPERAELDVRRSDTTHTTQLNPLTQRHCRFSPPTGASHGQELPPERMEALIRAAGRSPRQRTTLYGAVPAAQTAKSFGAAPLAPAVALPAGAAGAGAGGGSKGRR